MAASRRDIARCGRTGFDKLSLSGGRAGSNGCRQTCPIFARGNGVQGRWPLPFAFLLRPFYPMAAAFKLPYPETMTDSRIYTAALIVIGDEILSGRTHDKNIAQVASWLGVQGIRLKEVRVVADETPAIVEAVNALRVRNDYLFTTGGIGPTHDDITVDAIAEALGVAVVVHPEARAILEEYYTTRGGLTEARLRKQIALLQEVGVLDKPVAVSDVATFEFIPKASGK